MQKTYVHTHTGFQTKIPQETSHYEYIMLKHFFFLAVNT